MHRKRTVLGRVKTAVYGVPYIFEFSRAGLRLRRRYFRTWQTASLHEIVNAFAGQRLIDLLAPATTPASPKKPGRSPQASIPSPQTWPSPASNTRNPADSSATDDKSTPDDQTPDIVGMPEAWTATRGAPPAAVIVLQPEETHTEPLESPASPTDPAPEATT